MDPSQIPNDILRVLQDRELSMAKKMMAFNMLMPNLPPEPQHAAAYQANLKIGDTIKRLVDAWQLRLVSFDKKFILDVEVVV